MVYGLWFMVYGLGFMVSVQPLGEPRVEHRAERLVGRIDRVAFGSGETELITMILN